MSTEKFQRGFRVRSTVAAAALATVAAAACSESNAATLTSADRSFGQTKAVANPFGFDVDGSTVQSAIVTPADTFSVAVAGFNATTGDGVYLTAVVTPTFGTTGTFPNAATSSQTLTVVSSEAVGVSTTVDTFTVSVPTNFIPSSTFANSSGGSEVLNDVELDLGEGFGGSNPINFLLPVTSVTATGSILYSGGTLPLSPGTTLGAGNTSLAAFEAASTTATAGLSQFGIRQFTFTATYPTAVPEPASAGLLAVGGLVLARRRRR